VKDFCFVPQFVLAALALALSACVAPAPSPEGRARATVSAERATAAEQSARLYMQMHAVLSHPRCVNCHPRDDTPKQGLEQRVHSPPITRGPQDHGPLGLKCSACHTEANYDSAGVPGAPTWHLAPRSMAWEGKTAAELCRALTDRSRNGDRPLHATVEHLTEDKLVAWGWEPGIDVYGRPREPVPVPKEEFNRIVTAWAATGGLCPD
jgi:hypothetical protein